MWKLKNVEEDGEKEEKKVEKKNPVEVKSIDDELKKASWQRNDFEIRLRINQIAKLIRKVTGV